MEGVILTLCTLFIEEEEREEGMDRFREGKMERGKEGEREDLPCHQRSH